MASPDDFIPPLPGWEERSKFIGREGQVDLYHYDPFSQALSKIERGHDQDLKDVDMMLRGGLVDRKELLTLFEAIRPRLYRYPAIDPEAFAQAVHRITDDETFGVEI